MGRCCLYIPTPLILGSCAPHWVQGQGLDRVFGLELTHARLPFPTFSPRLCCRWSRGKTSKRRHQCLLGQEES